MPNTNGNTADIVVVGAGVIGTSIAFHLAKRRAGRVLVLEKKHVASGGTGRSSALIRMHYSFPPEVQLAVKSLEMFEHWREIVGEPGEFRKVGFVRIVPGNELDKLKGNVAMQKRYGVKADVIDCHELKKLEPDWNLDDEPAAAYEPESGYGDGAIAAQDLITAARAMGVEYRPRTEAIKIVTESGRVRGVITTEGEILAAQIVLAAGLSTVQLVQQLGFDLPISPEFHQVAILRNPPGMKPAGCACIDSVNTLYFRSDSNDKTLIGDFYGNRTGIDIENFPQRPSDDWVEETLENACNRIPKLQNAEVMKGVTGVYDMTPDARPLLGTLPYTGLYIAAGFSGTGFKIAPAIGLTISELLVDGAAKTVDISAFRHSRFQEGKPIKTEFDYQND